jgi:hypothetical protein
MPMTKHEVVCFVSAYPLSPCGGEGQGEGELADQSGEVCAGGNTPSPFIPLPRFAWGEGKLGRVARAVAFRMRW